MKYLTITLLLLASLLRAQDATIIYEEKSLTLTSDSKYTGVLKYQIEIHNKNGRNFAVYHDYEDKFRHINYFKLTLLDAQGKRVKRYTKEDIIDYSGNASYQIDDTQMLYLRPEYDMYPYTIEAEIRWTCKGYLGLPTWMPQSAFELAVKRSKLEISVPIGLKLRMKEINTEKGTLVIDDTQKLYTWEVHNLEPISDEMDHQLFYQRQPKVLLAMETFEMDGHEGSTTSWQSLGQWVYDLNEGRDELLPETLAFLTTVDTSNKRRAVSTVYQYMQNRTRYISIQLGIGGYQTIPADVVDESGFGDCKALTYYTRAMLKRIGIPAYGVLVRAGADTAPIDHDFPSTQFNHIFLGVPLAEDTVFLECTSQTQAFNYLGSFTDDRYVLWLDDGKSRLIKTPAYDETVNFQETKAIVKLDPLGNAIVTLKSLNKGYFSDDYDKYAYLGEKRFEQYAQSNFEYDDYVIEKFEMEPRSLLEPKYYANYILKVKALAKSAGENLLVPSNVLNSLKNYVHCSRYDKYAEVPRSFRIKEDVDLLLPSNVYIETLPDSVSFQSTFGSYHLQVERQENQVHVRREFVFNKGEYADDQFELFFQYLRQLNRAEKKYMVLNNKT